MTRRRFSVLALEAMSGEQRRVAESILGGRKSLDGPFNGMLHSPGLADPLQQVGAYLRFKSPLPPKLRELAIIVVARFWSAQYEWYVHRQLAEAAGFCSTKADQIAVGLRPDTLDGDEQVIFDFTSALLLTGNVSDVLFSRVAERFGELGASDLIGLAGYYCTASFFLNVDGQPIPAEAVPLPPLEGRPFASSAPGLEDVFDTADPRSKAQSV